MPDVATLGPRPRCCVRRVELKIRSPRDDLRPNQLQHLEIFVDEVLEQDPLHAGPRRIRQQYAEDNPVALII
jgi:hypothetical protein